MGIKVQSYQRRILAIEFSSLRELRNAFVRMQEHAEHPYFRNRIFTHDEYFEWCKKMAGQKSLASDWLGVAVERKHVDPFARGLFGKLSKEERLVVNATLKAGLRKDGSIIGYVKGRNDDLRHELAHAFYSQSKSYQQRVASVLRSLPPSAWKAVTNMLTHLDYAERRHKDEAHAYLLDGLVAMKKLDSRLRNLSQKNSLEIKRAKRELLKIFKSEAASYGITI